MIANNMGEVFHLMEPTDDLPASAILALSAYYSDWTIAEFEELGQFGLANAIFTNGDGMQFPRLVKWQPVVPAVFANMRDLGVIDRIPPVQPVAVINRELPGLSAQPEPREILPPAAGIRPARQVRMIRPASTRRPPLPAHDAEEGVVKPAVRKEISRDTPDAPPLDMSPKAQQEAHERRRDDFHRSQVSPFARRLLEIWNKNARFGDSSNKVAVQDLFRFFCFTAILMELTVTRSVPVSVSAAITGFVLIPAIGFGANQYYKARGRPDLHHREEFGFVMAVLFMAITYGVIHLVTGGNPPIGVMVELTAGMAGYAVGDRFVSVAMAGKKLARGRGRRVYFIPASERTPSRSDAWCRDRLFELAEPPANLPEIVVSFDGAVRWGITLNGGEVQFRKSIILDDMKGSVNYICGIVYMPHGAMFDVTSQRSDLQVHFRSYLELWELLPPDLKNVVDAQP